MRGVISGAIESLKAVFAVTVIMLVVIFIETIIAMNFFGGKLGDEVGQLVGSAGSPGHGIRWHFDYFSVAFASTWMCITTEAYTNVMYLAYDRVGAVSIFYFMQLISVGTWVMLNMFLAILCDEMASQLEQKNMAEEQQKKVDNFVALRFARKLQAAIRRRKGTLGEHATPALNAAKAKAFNTTSMLGHRMGIEPSPLAPELSAWEVAAYRTMFERATYESGERLTRTNILTLTTMLT